MEPLALAREVASAVPDPELPMLTVAELGILREVAAASGRRIVFFCAFGERSAMAVKAAREAGLANTAHIDGGMDAWKKAGGPVMHA